MRIAMALAVACVAACGPMQSSDGDGAPDTFDAVSNDSSVLDANGGDASASDGGDAQSSPSHAATRVVSFEPGTDATFGQDRMPGVVLGPPVGAGDQRGSTDVVSLGRNGRICVGFDDVAIVDGPGPDFVVFENPFYVGGTALLFYELGEVSVSDDGVNFVTFPCDPSGSTPPFPGCAGWNPVYTQPGGIAPDDLVHAGGDAFDLATVGLTRARVVCIRDLATVPPAPPTTGFDLDAVFAVNFAQ